MFTPQCKIKIYREQGNLTFNYVTRLFIENDWDNMTMNARVELPNKFVKEGKKVELQVERGSKIEVYLGYRPYLNLRFTGYVAKTTIGSPYLLECEGLMYKLKQKVLRNFNVDDYTLKEYVAALWKDGEVKDIDYDVSDTSGLGKIKYSGGTWTVAEMLQNIKDYGILTFQYGDKLKIGAPYTVIKNNERKTFKYIFNGQDGNIIDDSLKYQDSRDVKVVIEGESINSQTNDRTVRYAYYDNDKIKIDTEPVNGNVIDKKYINLGVTELESSIKRELELNNYTGFTGTFTTFGLFPVQVGDIISLTNNKYPSYNGSYYMKGYQESLAADEGYRHKMRLARKYE